MNDIFIKNSIEELQQFGYLMCHSRDAFFNELLDVLRRPFPKIEFIQQVGDTGIQQYIYLPRARRQVMGALSLDLQRYNQAAERTLKALRELEKRQTEGQ